ncbi:MAG: hypothetical protein Q8M65_05140, partial [Rhodoglobus sp.]|nr:hypothetical protein [Rhodoglobus sp.]
MSAAAPVGGESLSILLLGGGPAVGFGVRSHDLGLAGNMARQLAAASGRTVSVQPVTDIDMRADAAATALGSVALDGFDAVVTTFGGNDALCLTTDSSWRRSLRGFLAGVADAVTGMPTFVVGIAPITSIVVLPRIVRRRVDERVESLNRASRDVCVEFADATFVPFVPVVPTGVNLVDDASSAMYA